MQYSNKYFGQALKEIIEKKKIKLRSLANKTNLNYSYFSKLKKRKHSPPENTIEIIAAGLNISPEYFLEYRVNKVEKLLLDNPELINKTLHYINNSKDQRKLKVAERKKPFVKK